MKNKTGGKETQEALENWMADVTRRRFLLGVGLVVGTLVVRPSSVLSGTPLPSNPSTRRVSMPPGWPKGPVTFVQIGDFGAGKIHSGKDGPQATINPNAQNVAELVATYAPRRSATYVISAGDNVYVPYYGDPPSPPSSANGTNEPPPGDNPRTFQALTITPYDEAIGALYWPYISFPSGSSSVFAPYGSRRQRFFTVIGDHDWWHQPRQMVSGLPVYPLDTAVYPAPIADQPMYLPGTLNDQPSFYLQYFGNQGEGSTSRNTRYWDFTRGGIHWIGLSSDANETVLGTLSNAYYSTAPFPPQNLTPGQDNLQNSLQGSWFRSVAASPPKEWRFVVTHYPPYTSSAPSTGGHNPAAYMQWGFEDFGVDMVFSGHVHSYERLYVNGVTYIVNGAGGTFEALAGFVSSGGPSQVQVGDAYGILTAEKQSGKIFFSYLAIPPTTDDAPDGPTYTLRDRFVLLKKGVLSVRQMAGLLSIHVTPGGGGVHIPNDAATYGGNILGPGRLTKLGEGTWILSSASPDFTGTFALTRGVVLLVGDDLLSGEVTLLLRGGALSLASRQSFQTPLTVQGRSRLVVSGQTRLHFADSSAAAWSRSARLVIEGEPGPESIRFGNSASALTTDQLSRIRFGSAQGSPARLTAGGHLVPDSNA